jgi:lipoyl(octanoyl) transferase
MWRLVVGVAADSLLPDASAGAFNMAVDHALFERVQAGAAPVLRFYRWQPACLSLGRNQPARAQQQQLAALAIDVVRRPTGGLAVLHDQELTYSVAVRVGQLGSPRATYEAINRALLSGLLHLGVPAETFVADTTRKAFARAGSCFASTAPGEVGVGEHKLIGSAQRCERRTILQHGSILLDGDQAAVDVLLGQPGSSQPATALMRILKRRPDWWELVAAFRTGFEQVLGIALAPDCLATHELARARELTNTYAATEWTWRM